MLLTFPDVAVKITIEFWINDHGILNPMVIFTAMSGSGSVLESMDLGVCVAFLIGK